MARSTPTPPTPTPNPFEGRSTAELVDSLGLIKAQIANNEKQAKALQSELLQRAGDASHIDGDLYTATIVAEGILAKLDTNAIKETMGEQWCNQFLKFCTRSAYLLLKARKDHS